MDKNQKNDNELGQEELIENTDVSVEEFEQVKLLASQLEDKYKRALADYVNLQRRTDEQKINWMLSANKQLLLKLLPVLDTLMLASKHATDPAIALCIDQFIKALEGEGVTRIKTVGEMFDPNTMECVTTIAGEDGQVLEEVRAGFMQNELVLRSAQVIVGSEKQNK